MPLQVEIVLLKQLASCLAMPIIVVDPDGDLLFFNESAESIMGRPFEEMGEMGREELLASLRVTDEQGAPIPEADRPMIVAIDQGAPTHRRFWIEGFDRQLRKVEATTIPLIAENGSLLGALGLFWELERA